MNLEESDPGKDCTCEVSLSPPCLPSVGHMPDSYQKPSIKQLTFCNDNGLRTDTKLS